MKKEELRHDPIRENIVKGIQSLNDNASRVIFIIAVIMIIVGAFSYYNNIGSEKSRSASHLAGRAQNIFINGNLDEAFVKFERVLDDYPNTPGSVQSLVYLLSDAVKNNDLDEVSKLLSNNDWSIQDPVVLSAIQKLWGDVSLINGKHADAVKYYKKAHSSISGNVAKYKLDIAVAYIAQEKYSEALRTLEKIIDNESVGFSDKNAAEELMAFAKHKMSI